MLLVDLNVDCVDAFLNIIPGEKLLTPGKSLLSQFDESVSIPEGKAHEEFHTKFPTSVHPRVGRKTLCFHTVQ